ncbi:MAG: acyl-CoA dehydratase activase-related protein [Firmicutes bacterium]|nr:acyl-CoA dehydratase activase-related protein [Bacillota bacterium]
MKIGIPRALLYYWYGRRWDKFFRECGHETLISPPTDRNIIRAGSTVAVEELCLPVKIFLGHLQALAPEVDRVLVPHLVKVERDAFICPKFMGLPDIVAHTLPQIHRQCLTIKVGPKNISMEGALRAALLKAARKDPGLKPKAVPPAGYGEDPLEFSGSPALDIIRDYQLDPFPASVGPKRLNIGLLGHPYCIYDAAFNLNLLQLLKRNEVNVVTPEMLPKNYRGAGSGGLNKKLFWTTGRLQLDAWEWMRQDQTIRVAGFIQLSPFACGTEAVTGDLLERRIKMAKMPLLKLNFEEHSGEAGIITRVEAFLDLVRYHNARAC